MKYKQEVDDKIILNVSSPVTMTPPCSAPSGYRCAFPNFNPSLHVLNVDHVPDWFSSGDVIEYRRGRTFAVSLIQTEPRWKQWWRKLRTWLAKDQK